MHFLKKKLFDHAKKTAEYRRRVFGLEPSNEIARILKEGEEQLSLAKALLLIINILSVSPRAILKLAWHHLTDHDTPRRRSRVRRLAAELRVMLSSDCRVIEGYFERRLYSRDLARVPQTLEKILHRTTPLLVVQPRSETDVQAIVEFAKEKRLPLYPRGIASSPFGGAVPTMNGIVLDFSAMMRILSLDLQKQTVTVEAGVRWANLLEYLRPYGLSPLTTPTSLFSTVAGWAGTGGMGINSFAYGRFSESIIAYRVVLASGQALSVQENNPLFEELPGSEGQFCIVTELTLRVGALSEYSAPELYYFDSVEQALSFIDRILELGHKPAHVSFFDQRRMHEENELFASRLAADCNLQQIVEERDAVFLHFDKEENHQRFLADQAFAGQAKADLKAASYLWQERYFPLKAQRNGPSLLASEVVLPRNVVPPFIARSIKLAAYFGKKPTFEVTVSHGKDGLNCVTIASFQCNSREADYPLCLLLVQLLSRDGIMLGGRPYGFGIWNSPFWKRIFPEHRQVQMLKLKTELDPRGLLNPSKFFHRQNSLSNIPALLFIPEIYEGSLRLMHFLAPFLGFICRCISSGNNKQWQVPSEVEQDGKSLLQETITRCTSCGACISVCPAYLITRDELVTGRAKLRLAEALLKGEEILPHEAANPFQCLHCGLCEEVCQTNLPLRSCYRVLESMITERFGKPQALLESFTKKVDSSVEVLENAYGLSHPEWSPEKNIRPSDMHKKQEARR